MRKDGKTRIGRTRPVHANTLNALHDPRFRKPGIVCYISPCTANAEPSRSPSVRPCQRLLRGAHGRGGNRIAADRHRPACPTLQSRSVHTPRSARPANTTGELAAPFARWASSGGLVARPGSRTRDCRRATEASTAPPPASLQLTWSSSGRLYVDMVLEEAPVPWGPSASAVSESIRRRPQRPPDQRQAGHTSRRLSRHAGHPPRARLPTPSPMRGWPPDVVVEVLEPALLPAPAGVVPVSEQAGPDRSDTDPHGAADGREPGCGERFML